MTKSEDENSITLYGETYNAVPIKGKNLCCCHCDLDIWRRVFSDSCKQIPCHPSKRKDKEYVIFKKA